MNENNHTRTKLYFAKDDEFSPEEKKSLKKLGNEVFDKIKHSLMADKKTKLPKKYSHSFLSLCIFDTLMRSSDRAFYYNKKSKELLLFIVRGKEVSLDIVALNGEEDVFTEAENRFLGNPYIEISGSEKELSSQYKENQTVLTIVLFVAIIGLLYGGYVFMFAEDTVVVDKIPPPKPIVKPIDQFEENILRNELSIKTIDYIIQEIDRFKEREVFDIKRIASIEVPSFTLLAPSEPTLDEASNTWVYEGDTEKLKRGGFEVTIDVQYQQKFPSNGFVLETEGTEEQITLYTKSESSRLEIFATELENNNTKLGPKTLDRECLESTLRVVTNILPFSQDASYIGFQVKNTLPSYFYYDMRTLLRGCPLEFKSISVSGGEFVSELNMFKIAKQEQPLETK